MLMLLLSIALILSCSGTVCETSRPEIRISIGRPNNERGGRTSPSLRPAEVSDPSFDRRYEYVAFVADRLDEARFARVFAKALAQAAYQQVDRAVE